MEEKIKSRKEVAKQKANELNDLRLEYRSIKDSAAFGDILRFARQMSAYHTKVAKDGVAYNEKAETVNLDPQKRLSELDRAAGIEEIVAYLERMTDEGVLN